MNAHQRVKYWEIIADNLSKGGLSCDCVSAIDSAGGTIWIVDAHGYEKRFIVRAEQLLTALLELERPIRACGESPRQLARFLRDSPDMKITMPLILVTFALICFALSPMLQAQNQNTRFGVQALDSNTSGDKNTAIGFQAMTDNTSGSTNTATGSQALFLNTTGNSNTATGYQALQNNTTGGHNTASGLWALRNNTAGFDNTASGYEALFHNTTGLFNTANGSQALSSNTTGRSNTANGEGALQSNTTGIDNTATGSGALNHNTNALGNTANGSEALVANTTGERNTAIGWHSLEKNTTGSFNVAVGAGAGSGVTTADDVISIGRAAAGVNVGGTCFIGNIRGVQTQNANALPVVIDGAGQLGTVASSERFKKDIAIMGQASEGILSLRPVTFHYKTDGTSTPQFGLIAEEVANVNPALVVSDKEGKPYTVRYDAVNAMLLNEFLKEHRTVHDLKSTVAKQEATIAQQQTSFQSKLAEQEKQIEALSAGLQKVSAQLELSKFAAQTVLNGR